MHQTFTPHLWLNIHSNSQPEFQGCVRSLGFVRASATSLNMYRAKKKERTKKEVNQRGGGVLGHAQVGIYIFAHCAKEQIAHKSQLYRV